MFPTYPFTMVYYPVFFITGWVVKMALILVGLVTGTCACIGACTCCYMGMKRICQYRCPSCPVLELTWFASSDDARQARTMLQRANFAPINMKFRRVRPAKKVILTSYLSKYCS